MGKRIKIKTVILLWLLLSGTLYTYSQDYSTWGEIYDYEIGDVFHIHESEYAYSGGGMVRLILKEIVGKNFSANMDTVFYTSFIETAYIDSGMNEWIYDSYYGTETYFNLDSLFLADSVYYTSQYNGRKISRWNFSIPYTWNEWQNFVDGCGRVLKHWEELNWIYGYEGNKVLKYYKKGDEEWGTPIILVDIAERQKVYENVKTYPNPFKTSTTIEYELSEPSRVQLSIYNAIGEAILLADEGSLPPGKHSFTWTPERLSEGLYYAVLRSGKGVSVIKMIKQ